MTRQEKLNLRITGITALISALAETRDMIREANSNKDWDKIIRIIDHYGIEEANALIQSFEGAKAAVKQVITEG